MGFTICWQVTFCFGLCQLNNRVCTGVHAGTYIALRILNLWATAASPHGIQTSVFSKSCLSTFCARSWNGIRLPKILCSLKCVPMWNSAKWISSLIFHCDSPTVYHSEPMYRTHGIEHSFVSARRHFEWHFCATVQNDTSQDWTSVMRMERLQRHYLDALVLTSIGYSSFH